MSERTQSSSLLLASRSHAPVISPPQLTTRLSKEEIRAATAAFHRARGHCAGLDFVRFCDSVLCEAFAAMPALLTHRIFAVWRYLAHEDDDSSDIDISTGELSLTEFLVGVMVVTKGSRDEHLHFVFQLMDTSGTQALGRRDTLEFLAAVARPHDSVVAVEAVSTPPQSTGRSNVSNVRTWTVNELADWLHPMTGSSTELLSLTSFVKRLRSKSFTSLLLVDWIAVFATQFSTQTPTQQPLTSPLASPTSTPISNNVPDRPNGSSSLQTPCIIAPLPLSLPLFAAIQTECFSILDYLVNTNDDLTSATFTQRLQPIMPTDVLEAIEHVNALFPAPGIAGTDKRNNTSDRGDGRARFRHLVLILLSVFAHSAGDVMRLLFALFDNDRCNSLDVFAVATFLRFATRMTLAESERTAFAMRAELHERSAALYMTHDKFQSLVAHPPASVALDLPSPTDLTVLHLLVQLQRAATARPSSSTSSEATALKQFTTHLRLAKQDAPSAQLTPSFCLLERRKWLAIIAFVCDAAASRHTSTTASASDATNNDSDTAIDDAHDALAHDVDVVSNDPAALATSERRTDDIVLVPLLLWVTLAFWQQQHSQLSSTSDWRMWTTHVCFISDENEDETSTDALRFDGYCVRVSLTTLRGVDDGSKASVESPVLQTIVSGRCSTQDVVDAAQLQHQLINKAQSQSLPPNSSSSNQQMRPRTAICECRLECTADAPSSLSSDPSAVALVQAEQLSFMIPIEWMALPLTQLLALLLPENNICVNDATRSSSSLTLVVSVALMTDANDAASISTTATSASPNQQRRSPLPAATTTTNNSVRGLTNLGNTCFMNSALQCLVATPLLREYFSSHEYLYDLGVRSATSLRNDLPVNNQLSLALGQLVTDMSAFASTGTTAGGVHSAAAAISPVRLHHATALRLPPHLMDGAQQDAQEFLSSLLCSLSDELQRVPVQKPPMRSALGAVALRPATEAAIAMPTTSIRDSSSSILSPQSRAFLARLPSIARRRESDSSDATNNTSDNAMQHLRFHPRDSNGRPDATVANEWWIAHLIREPSLITILFSGQFKSVLTCTRCHATSVRFEPFASLQLPIASSDASGQQQQQQSLSSSSGRLDVVVIVHFAVRRPALRLAVHLDDEAATLEELVQMLQREYEQFGLQPTSTYVACVLDSSRIVDVIDADALLATLLPAPLDVFELEPLAPLPKAATTAQQQRPVDRTTFAVGDGLLVWTPGERLVRSVVTHVRLPPTLSTSSPQSPISYDVKLREGLHAGRLVRAVANVQSLSTLQHRVLTLRIVHRRHVLVPFYCHSPRRLVLCGTPSVMRVRQSSLLTGSALYRLVEERFVSAHTQQLLRATRATSATAASPLFVLRRVRDDGLCCQHCHWSAQCNGCIVARSSSAVLSDVAMDETLALDWDVDQLGIIDTDDLASLLSLNGAQRMCDDASFVRYRQSSAQTLTQSLRMLCNSEQLDATCNACERRAAAAWATTNPSATRPQLVAVPHTKTLSLWRVPPILIIQLQRFELSPGAFTWRKVSDAIDFPLDALDVAPFVGADENFRPTYSNANNNDDAAEGTVADERVSAAAGFLHKELCMPLDSASRDVTRYRLYGVVNHVGAIGSGHYTAHIKESSGNSNSQNDNWWFVDDATSAVIDIQRFVPSAAAYVLFYVRDDVLPSTIVRETRAEATGAQHERVRLASLFPRQAGAVKLQEPPRKHAWQTDAARPATPTIHASPWSPKSKHEPTSEQRSDDVCCIT